MTRAAADGQEYVLAVFDIDHFRTVRNLYGSGASEFLVRMLGSRLDDESTQLGGRTMRLGADEFAVLVPLSRCGDSLEDWGRRVLASASLPLTYRETRLVFTLSLGMSVLSGSSLMASEALRCARHAVTQGKQSGGGTATTCTSRQLAEALCHGELARELPGAIATGQLIPFYQPVVSLPDCTIVGMEVLARWSHPKHGTLDPLAFIGAAEEQGLCTPLTQTLLQQARRDAANWPEEWTFAFNTTPNELPAVLLVISSADQGPVQIMTPTRIELEVTETAMMRDVELSRRTVSDMQPCGVKVVLDDFGTGYANFKHLSQVPFSRLKIDKSLITDILKDRRAEGCVKAIIGIAHHLGMTATGEGVESAEVADRLVALGCDYAQGYYFGRPVSAAEIDALVALPPALQPRGLHYAA